MQYKDRDWLYLKYILENKSAKCIGEECGVHASSIYRFVKKFKLEKEKDKIQEIRKKSYDKTCLIKYGDKNPFNNSNLKHNTLQKRKETLIEKYGVDSPLKNKDMLDKLKKTNIEKYGTPFSINNSEIRAKALKTLGKNYNVNVPFKNYNIKKKAEDTLLEKFGVKNSCLVNRKESIKKRSIDSWSLNINIEDILDFFGANSIGEISDSFGVPRTIFYNFLNKNLFYKIEDIEIFLKTYESGSSYLENKISNELKIGFYNKKVLNYRPDFKIDHSTYLNVDGLYWHSEFIKKDKMYHFNLRKDFEENGLRIFQFREDEINFKFDIIKSIINNVSKKSSSIYARKTKISDIESKKAKDFLNNNHIMGYTHAKHIGLYHQGSLMMIMSYVIKNNVLKIERIASKCNLIIIGGFSKLLKSILNKNNISIIYYWVDLRYGTGNFLANFGFKIHKEILSWKWTDRVYTYNRLQCKARMDKRALSQSEYAKELNWNKIYDAGQRLWVKYIDGENAVHEI